MTTRQAYTFRQEQRDLSYTHWHLTTHLRLKSIDLDGIEYYDRCGNVVALIEVAWDKGQEDKPTTIMRRVAADAGYSAYLVFYRKRPNDQIDAPIVRFRVRQVHPRQTGEIIMSPEEYEQFLWWLRARPHKGSPHGCLPNDIRDRYWATWNDWTLLA